MEKERIRERFGDAVFDEAGNIMRPALGERVFSEPEALSFLNGLIHPLVRQDFREWCLSGRKVPYVIHEAAIIFESGFAKEYDRIICVSCPKEDAIRRITERDGTPREHILRRMQHQMEDQEKAALSDFVIRNDGSEMLIPQVLKIHGILSESAP